MNSTRRSFLLSAGKAAILGAIAPRVFAVARDVPARPIARRHSLVVVELTGGNDGLSTICPIHDAVYRDKRPKLAFDVKQTLAFDDKTFVPTTLSPWKDLWDARRMSIIESVGYPKPNRSHFGSMDIWHTADVPTGTVMTGWLGRARAAEVARLPQSERPLFFIGDGPAPLALTGGPDQPICLPSAEKMRGAGDVRTEAPRARNARQSDFDFLLGQDVALEKVGAAVEKVARRTPGVDYPRTAFARQLALTAGLIDVGFDQSTFYLRLDGFDTHAGQREVHSLLLEVLAKGVRAFTDDLRKIGAFDRVTIMVYSEFGRRVAENGSAGTDHGAAGPMILFGEGLKPGRRTEGPDLVTLIDGDIRPRVDFRDVYAACLEHRLGEPDAAKLCRAPKTSKIDLFA